ncbi:serine hydrolase [Ideonella sp. A 288]|uniref:serine hydrolase n=1 Tax=Ideonella sp. A 288 TaxID=1962181 RepID=UPI000B4B0CAE|nr:serine hydrolase [Ideonella sp. A 288]
MPHAPPTHADLAQALLDAVRAQPWHEARDRRTGGAPFSHPPSLDLAVAVFPPAGAPRWANVLFSRERPAGWVAAIGDDAGAVSNVAYLVDPLDAHGVSAAWQPGADWSQLSFAPLAGHGPARFVAPYPASLVKLMVAVGAAQLVDRGAADWDERWTHAGRGRALADWAEPMLTESSNLATDAMVALLHARGLIRRDDDGPGGREAHNDLHALFASQHLGTLRLADTRATGGWRNADGAGVGHLQMTAWDTVRLLWRLQDVPAPWLAADAPPMLSTASRTRLMGWLWKQRQNEVLSSGSQAHHAGWPAGIAGRFAHKTGTTETYASDAGRVELPGGGLFLIALLTSLGRCAAPHDGAATDANVPRLGAAVEAWVKTHMAMT